MSYTHENLRDAEDVAPGLGIAALQEVRFPDLGAARTGLALMGVKPGRSGAEKSRRDGPAEGSRRLGGHC